MEFLNYLNKQHTNIKFTMEYEANDKLSFLDILIEKTNGRFEFGIFRKPTFSGLGISFFSFCCHTFKINSVKTLLHRAYSLTSSYERLHAELTFLKSFFLTNGFPLHIFQKLVYKFLNKKYQHKPEVQTASKLPLYFRLPYLGDLSSDMKNSLFTQLSYFYPQIDFKFVFVNNFKINTFFKFKDRLPNDLRSSVIYMFTCPSCQTGYIGSTVRAYKCRTDEHLGQSSRTGRPLLVPSHSVVREHLRSCNIRPKKDYFKIIDSCSGSDIRILESLYIKKFNPELNTAMSACPLHIV